MLSVATACVRELGNECSSQPAPIKQCYVPDLCWASEFTPLNQEVFRRKQSSAAIKTGELNLVTAVRKWCVTVNDCWCHMACMQSFGNIPLQNRWGRCKITRPRLIKEGFSVNVIPGLECIAESLGAQPCGSLCWDSSWSRCLKWICESTWCHWMSCKLPGLSICPGLSNLLSLITIHIICL